MIELTSESIKINGKDREYLISRPASPEAILFMFHGHGGQAGPTSIKYGFHKKWPTAIVIYPQGIPGIGGGFDPKGLKNAWQRAAGQGDDRDIYLVDALVAKLLKEYPDLKNNVFAIGHSNGGKFIYVLWQQRASLFRGLGVSAAQGTEMIESLEPKSCILITGKKDTIVKADKQIQAGEMIKKLMATDQSKIIDALTTEFSNSKTLFTFCQLIHEGAHDMTAGGVNQAIRFFSDLAK